MPDVDLDRLARGYRHRPASATSLSHARVAAAGLNRSGILLDVGAGRGEHAAVWAAMGYGAVAVDPSAAMAAAADGHEGVTVVVGRAQSLPFKDSSLTLAYFHLSLHYGDWNQALDEVVRVLRPGGRCEVWTLSARHHRASMLARWFPSVGDIDSTRFPDPDLVVSAMRSRGLAVQRGTSREHVTRSAGDWTAAVRFGFVSTLQLLSRSELDAGLDAFERAHPDPAEVIEYDLDYDWIRATLPPR